MWSIRRLTALACAVAMVVPAAAVTALVVPARADDQSAMQFLGFIHDTDLVRPDGTTLDPDPGAVKPIGVDEKLGLLPLLGVEPGDAGVYLVDTHSLAQVASIATQTGTPGVTIDATALDRTTHRVYLGTSVATSCPFLIGVACEVQAGPGEIPQIETVGLSEQKSLGAYTLPAAAAGLSVAALEPTTTPSGRHVLLALLYEDRVGQAVDPRVAHRTVLYAFDADELTHPHADPVLWSDDVSSCASLMSYSLNATYYREFLGVDPAGHYVYFGCRGMPTSDGHLSPSGAIVIDLGTNGDAKDLPASANTFTPNFYPYGASTNFSLTSGDSTLGILLMIVMLSYGDKVYAFDVAHRAWTGSMPLTAGDSTYGAAIDPTTGDAYVYPPTTNVISTDVTQVPVPQQTLLSLGDLKAPGGSSPVIDTSTKTLFLGSALGAFKHADGSTYPADDEIAVYRDTRPAPQPEQVADPDAETHDIPVTDDTPVTFGSFASAYGTRLSLVGGTRAINNGNTLGPAQASDGACNIANSPFTVSGSDPQVPCHGLVPSTTDSDRTFTFGDVSQNEMSNSAATASATTMSVDDSTNADSQALSSYNPAVDLWNRFVQPNSGQDPPQAPDGSPAPPSFSADVAPATCSDYGSDPTNKTAPGSLAGCDHSSQQASAAAASDALAGPNGATAEPDPSRQTSPIEVGYAGAATTVLHTADNQAVTEAKAVARNISLAIPSGPAITIGEVTTTAVSAAAGRPGTASSQFNRMVSNVVIRDPSGQVAYSCGFAGADANNCDPRQITNVVSAQSPFPVMFVMPDPDSTVRGTPGGADAEITKSAYQRWNDYFTNADSSYEIPGLQVIFVGDQDQPSRLVASFAGVRVQSHDAIGLPPPPIPPLPDPTLKLSLTDGSTPAVPLAGGEFALVAEDGTTVATCSTAADGIGSCSFTGVKPGSYTVKETKAPPGYATAPDYQISLDPGQDYTATFVNLLAIGAVHVALTSAVDKKPLSGAVFAMYAGSSVLGTALATCTTGKDGTCGFAKVPLGSYTMHQQSAPKGFLTTDDYAFDLTDPGQDATLTFTDGTPGVKAVKGKFIPGKPAVAPHTEIVGGGGTSIPAVPAAYSTPSDIPPLVSSAPAAQAPVIAGLPQRIAQLPAQLAKLLTHSPQQAVLLLFVWLVFGMPIYLWARRRQLLSAIEGT